MYEVIVSSVGSGKVERRSFGTRDEAEVFVDQVEAEVGYNTSGLRIEKYYAPGMRPALTATRMAA
jgi:hypothetical protein